MMNRRNQDLFVLGLSELNIDIPAHTLDIGGESCWFLRGTCTLARGVWQPGTVWLDPKTCTRFPQFGWCLKLSCRACKEGDVKIDQELSRLTCVYAEKNILRSSSAHSLKTKFRATLVQGKMFSERPLPSRKNTSRENCGVGELLF